MLRIRSITRTTTLGATLAAIALTLGGCHVQARVEAAAPVLAPPPEPPAAPPPALPSPPQPQPAPPPQPKIVPFGRAEIHGGLIHIPGVLEFEKGRSTISRTTEGDEILTTLLELMKTNTVITRLRVEVHTDDAGNDARNVVLSQARADAVVAWLSTNGVSAGRLVAKGYGAVRPVAPNDTEEHRKQNRRTEFHVQEIDGQPLVADVLR